MAKRSNTNQRRKISENQLAKRLLNELTPDDSDVEERILSDDVRHLIAAALGRQGGLKGGKARAEKLSPERRKEIAKKAAEARWSTRSSE